MTSGSERETILEAAVAGIPRVAQAIAETPAEHRAKALDAAERSYRETLQDLGYEEGPVQGLGFRSHASIAKGIGGARLGETENAGSVAKRTFAGRDRGR
jgi:hypothetical protein